MSRNKDHVSAMPSMYYIYGGGRWREIDVETGRVAGWAGSNFAYIKRGKLVVLKRKPVLKGLKELKAGRISTVKHGPQLSQLLQKKIKSIKSPKTKCKCCYQHMCTSPNVKKVEPKLLNASIQCNIVPNKQNNQPVIENDTKSIASGVSDNIARAITISESDVETFRSYILNDKKNIFNVDLFMYDANDDYKRSIFYKITPIVKVQRHPVIHSLLKQKQFKVKLNSAEMRNGTNALSKAHKGIHCEPKIKIIEYDKDSSDGEAAFKISKPVGIENSKEGGKRKADMEISNEPKKIRQNDSNNSNNIQKHQNETSVNKVYLVKKWSVKNGRKRPINEFSLLEDEAIVSWILKNKKGNSVNGNKMWKEMEPMHIQLTGHYRSWHSLRNRYLRHLLPALGNLSLTPSQAAGLRAAAATGELKARKNSRRNSIYHTAPVRSAWNARRQKPKLSDDEPSIPPLLRSSALSPSRRELPSYSEITRRFAEKHRSTPNSNPEEDSQVQMKFNYKTNKENENYNLTDKQPRVSLKMMRTGYKEGRSLRVLNVQNERSKKMVNSEKSRYQSDEEENDLRKGNVNKADLEQGDEKQGRSEDRSRRLRGEEESRREARGVDRNVRRRRNNGEADMQQEKKNKNDNGRSSRRLRGEERSVVNHKNEDTDTENEGDWQDKKHGKRSSRRFRSAEKSHTENKNLRQDKSNDESEREETNKQDKKLEKRSSRRFRSPETSHTENKNLRQDRSNDESETEETNKQDKKVEKISSRRFRSPVKSHTENKNIRQDRSNDESETEETNKQDKKVEKRSSRRFRSPEKSHEENKNLRQDRSNDESEREETNKQDKKLEKRSSRRFRSPEKSHEENKNLRQDRSNDESETEETNKQDKKVEKRSSRRFRSPVKSHTENKNIRQGRSNDESEREQTNKQDKKLEKRSSRRFRSPEKSHTENKNLKQGRSNDESETEETNKQDKKRENRSSRSRRSVETSKTEKEYSRHNKKDVSDTEYEDERQGTTEVRKSIRSSRRHRSVEESLKKQKNTNEAKDYSDKLSENKNKVNNDFKRRRGLETSDADKEKLRLSRNKDESDTKPVNLKRDKKGRFLRRPIEKKRSGVDENLGQHKNKDTSDTELEDERWQDNKKTRENTRRISGRLRSLEGSDAEETKKQNKECEKRFSKRVRSPKTSQTEEKNYRRGSLEINKDRTENDASSRRSNKKMEDKENGNNNKMYLRQYQYKGIGNAISKTKRAIGHRKFENGHRHEQARKNISTDKSGTLKVDRSKRKRTELSNSDTENDQEKSKSKREKRETDSDVEFVKTFRKQRDRSDSEFSVEQVSQTSTSEFDSSNDIDRRVTRQSHRDEINSRDNIVFEISDNDEAYASRSDTERPAKKRHLRKLFNHRAV